MHRFQKLSEAYAAALLASDDGMPEPGENDACSSNSSDACNKDLVTPSAEEEDLETARTRPLRLDTLHL